MLPAQVWEPRRALEVAAEPFGAIPNMPDRNETLVFLVFGPRAPVFNVFFAGVFSTARVKAASGYQRSPNS